MIELRTHNGPEDEFQVMGNKRASLITDTAALSFQIGAGDHWIFIDDKVDLQSVNIRVCANSGGGNSPHVRTAIANIIAAGIAGETQYSLPLHHDFEATRQEGQMSLTAKLTLNALSLGIDGYMEYDTDKPSSARFAIPLDQCPVAMRAPLVDLAYAILEDNEQTIGSTGIEPLRPVWERNGRSWKDYMHPDDYIGFPTGSGEW